MPLPGRRARAVAPRLGRTRTPGSDQVRRRARPARRLSASQRGGLTAGAARPRRAGSAAPRLGDSATPPLSRRRRRSDGGRGTGSSGPLPAFISGRAARFRASSKPRPPSSRSSPFHQFSESYSRRPPSPSHIRVTGSLRPWLSPNRSSVHCRAPVPAGPGPRSFGLILHGRLASEGRLRHAQSAKPGIRRRHSPDTQRLSPRQRARLHQHFSGLSSRGVKATPSKTVLLR